MGRSNRQSAASTPRRVTRSQANASGRADAAPVPAPHPPALDPAHDPPTPIPTSPLTPSTTAAEAHYQALGVVLAAQAAAVARAVSPIGDADKDAPSEPYIHGSPLSDPTQNFPLSHGQSSPPVHSSPPSLIHSSEPDDQKVDEVDEADEADDADERPPPTQYPDERNDYDGKSLRHVAARYHYKLPAWYHDSVTDEMLDNTHPVTYVPSGTPQPSDVADHSDFGVMIIVNNSMRQSLSFPAAYIGFKRLSDFKCFAQTKAADTMHQAFRLLRVLPSGSQKRPRIRSVPHARVFANILRLKDSGMAHLVEKILDPTQKLPSDLWTVVATVVRVVRSNPHVFRERPGSAPIGSRFVLGSTMEDYARGLALWSWYSRSRTSVEHKSGYYQFKNTLHKTFQYPLRMFRTAAATREAMRVRGDQDPLMAVLNEVDRHPVGLSIPPVDHARACQTIHAALGSDLTRRNVDVYVREHAATVLRVLHAFSPDPIHRGDRDCRPRLSPTDLGDLGKQLYRNATRTTTRAVDHTLLMAAPAQGNPLEHLLPNVPDKKLTLIHRRLPMPEHLRSRHGRLVHQLSSLTGGQEIAQAISVDHNASRLLRVAKGDAALQLLSDDCKTAVAQRAPLLGARDAGVSWVFRKTVTDSGLGVPLARAHLIAYLTSESPSLAYALSVIITVALADERILVLTAHTMARRLLVLLLDVAGVPFLDLPDSADDGAGPLEEYGRGTRVCVCGSRLPVYAAAAMNHTAYGIYIGAPDIHDLPAVVATLYHNAPGNAPGHIFWHVVFTCGTSSDATFGQFVQSLAQWSPPGWYARMQYFEQLRANLGTKPMDFNWFPFTILDVPTGSGALEDWAIMGHRVSQLLSACQDDDSLPDRIDEAKPADVVGAIFFIGRLGLTEAWDRVDGDAKQLLSSTMTLHLPKASLPSGVVLDQLTCMAGRPQPPFPTSSMRHAAHQAFVEGWADNGDQAFVTSVDNAMLGAPPAVSLARDSAHEDVEMVDGDASGPDAGGNATQTAVNITNTDLAADMGNTTDTGNAMTADSATETADTRNTDEARPASSTAENSADV